MKKRVLYGIVAIALIWWCWPRETPVPQDSTPHIQQAKPGPKTPLKRIVRSAPPRVPVVERDTAERDEEEPRWTVRCPLPMDAPYEGEVVFAEVQPLNEGVLIARVPAEVRNGVLLLEASDPTNRGTVRVPGYPDLDWRPSEEGGCPSVSLKVVSAVVGTVSPPWGEVRVSACGTSRDADADGSFYVPATPGICEVEAYRIDSGGVFVYGDQTTVEVLEGEDALVDLTVPDREWGTLGLTLRTRDGVTRVRSITTGAAAHTAGIRAGDRVVEIDGQPASACDRGWLDNCTHGPLGSTVTVEFEDGEVLELERERMPER